MVLYSFNGWTQIVQVPALFQLAKCDKKNFGKLKLLYFQIMYSSKEYTELHSHNMVKYSNKERMSIEVFRKEIPEACQHANLAKIP